MPKPLVFFLLLSVSSIFSKTSDGSKAFVSNCPSHVCGGVIISYPFWITSNTTSNQYCGYPGFNLSCSNEKNTIINLGGDSYYVKNIGYTDYTLTLVDVAVVANETCPRARNNVTIQTLPLSYNRQDLNLSFYFNCSPGIVWYPKAPPNATECLSSKDKDSFVFVNGKEPAALIDYWYHFCEEKVVVVAVMEWEIDANNFLNEGFGGVMKDGFVLDWRQAPSCGACEESIGLCGFDNTNDDFLCFCSDGSKRTNDTCKATSFFKGGNKLNVRRKLVIAVSTGGGIMIILLLCCIVKKLRQSKSIFFWKTKTEIYRNIEAFLKNCGSLSPKRYTYSDIKKITDSFRTKLGQGGFGCVYKGKLENGCLVAVKVLKGLKGNGDEFINEVATISRTSHVHIVTLLGFCFEGSHRALIYEFMPNGSLDKFIHDGGSLTNRELGWEALYQIAVGIARGLEYLHRGCNTRILHFDIKPHNILLNEDFFPKISDFGLAKLCPQKESIISLLGARGTVGYIAPEVFSRNFGGVSHKSDVYSYGMMVLEMVGQRKNNSSVEVDHTSETYFPHWVYKRLELDEELGSHGITGDEANASARKMIIVGLWCIQIDPSHRPSMSRVLGMLEGSLESLEIPPKPFLSSPSRAPIDSSTTQSTLMSQCTHPFTGERKMSTSQDHKMHPRKFGQLINL